MTQEMRTRISACALDLFKTEGYATVSMRRLAKEVGCTTMTLYQYYDSKFSVLASLWSHIFDELFAQIAQISARDNESVKKLVDICECYVDFWIGNKEYYFIVFMSGGISKNEVEEYVTGGSIVSHFDTMRECLRHAIGEQQDEETLRLKSELLICILNGIAHNLITISGYEWSDPKKLLLLAVDGLLATP